MAGENSGRCRRIHRGPLAGRCHAARACRGCIKTGEQRIFPDLAKRLLRGFALLAEKNRLAAVGVVRPFVEDQHPGEIVQVFHLAQSLVGKRIMQRELQRTSRVAGAKLQSGLARDPLARQPVPGSAGSTPRRRRQSPPGPWYLLVQASTTLHPGDQFLNREARRSSWEASKTIGIPLWEARFRKKKKPEQWSRPIPHADLWFLKKNYRFFFFFAAFFAFFLAALFFGFDFFAFFFGSAFFL